MFEHVSEAFIAAQNREQIQPLRTRILQIVESFRRHHDEVTAVCADFLLIQVKNHFAAQHEEQFSGPVMGMGWHTITRIVNLQEQRG